MPISISDIAILLVSLAACVYCMVLSRRLRALHDTKEGLGATITAMSNSISGMSLAAEQTQARVGNTAGQLSQLLVEAQAAQTNLDTLIDRAGRREAESIATLKAVHGEVEHSLLSLLKQSQSEVSQLTLALKAAKRLRAHQSMDTRPRAVAPRTQEGVDQ